MSAKAAEGVSLHHVIVVGGTPAEWAELPEDQWSARLAELGKVVDHVGGEWLAIQPFGPDAEGDAREPVAPERSTTVGACHVVTRLRPDGRARLAQVVAALQQSGGPITEASISAGLNQPATVDPDLVVVVGPGHRMPPSLVWELAYSELVFVDTSWGHFGPGHLDEAIGSYARRHRRFGGID